MGIIPLCIIVKAKSYVYVFVRICKVHEGDKLNRCVFSLQLC